MVAFSFTHNNKEMNASTFFTEVLYWLHIRMPQSKTLCSNKRPAETGPGAAHMWTSTATTLGSSSSSSSFFQKCAMLRWSRNRLWDRGGLCSLSHVGHLCGHTHKIDEVHSHLSIMRTWVRIFPASYLKIYCAFLCILNTFGPVC